MPLYDYQGTRNRRLLGPKTTTGQIVAKDAGDALLALRQQRIALTHVAEVGPDGARTPVAIAEALALADARRLLDRSNRETGALRRHLAAYLGVNTGLLALNAVLAFSRGDSLETAKWWAPIVAASWGIGMLAHAFTALAWRHTHAQSLTDARKLVSEAAVVVRSLPPAARVESTDPMLSPVGVLLAVDSNTPWDAVVRRCEDAVSRTEVALAHLPSGVALRGELTAGLERIRKLAAGAVRLRRVVREIAPDGPGPLASAIAELDQRIVVGTDARLRSLLESNRALLVARQAKLQALDDEEQRMLASVDGFLMAAENARLDVARIETAEPRALPSLVVPLGLLDEEVALLREVEAGVEVGS